ncbi:FMN-binding protein [Mariniblastus fucicola]|uniref:Electron transport protein YccM n=1 Tax=Mariniblastus fucicola TaxID=980251 RepID=A0A5B9PSP7_9BACT|nr:FMN-binding protein [Mariniblastus fucicola]QEG25253.1 Putative electron transport protein YccM [Mariniblastus fucicola]
MPVRSKKRNPPLKRVLVHVLRVAIFVSVLWLIRDAHRQTVWSDADLSNSPQAIEFVQQSVPEATGIAGERVVDSSGNAIGSILQTSPQSDHIIGYSGPTNCLIVLDAENQIVSVAIANSGDTVDHVRAVKDDPDFAKAFSGLGFETSDQWQQIDAVSGATLTSYAIIASVANRMGGSAPSLKFEAQPDMENVRALFDDAVRIELTDRSNIWDVFSDSAKVGFLLTTSPFADQLSGYQGPTMTLAGFDNDGKCVGLVVDQTYENQPYASYLNDDRPFQKFYVGKTLEQLAELSPEDSGIDGVSGATMTSLCVADGLVLAAKAAIEAPANDEAGGSGFSRRAISWWADAITVLLTIFGMLLSFGQIGKSKSLRIAYQLAVILFLGLINGHMLSQASVVGWSKNAIPWSVAPGLVLLSIAAFVVPIVSKHQPYCHHICPFGAIQQLAKKRSPWPVVIPKTLNSVLEFVPFALLLLVVIVAMTGTSFNLASIEPFDAFAFRVAGWATIGVFVVGLVASLVSPMAYCRFGCPTGALLGFLKFRADSHRIGSRDWAAMLLLVAAILFRVVA